MPIPILFSWSGGKDSAIALHALLEQPEHWDVVALLTGVFPIWQRDTRELVDSFVTLGFRAVLCCVEGAKLDGSFVGRELDSCLVADLPPGVDPCGENGEYHSFVYDGPIFQWPVRFET